MTNGKIMVVSKVTTTIAEYSWVGISHVLKTIIATANQIAPLLFIARPTKWSWCADKSLTNGLDNCVQINFPAIAPTSMIRIIRGLINRDWTSKANHMLIKKNGIMKIFKTDSIFNNVLWCLHFVFFNIDQAKNASNDAKVITTSCIWIWYKNNDTTINKTNQIISSIIHDSNITIPTFVLIFFFSKSICAVAHSAEIERHIATSNEAAKLNHKI